MHPPATWTSYSPLPFLRIAITSGLSPREIPHNTSERDYAAPGTGRQDIRGGATHIGARIRVKSMSYRALAPSPSGRGRGVRGLAAWHTPLKPSPSPSGRGDRTCALCDKHLELNLAPPPRRPRLAHGACGAPSAPRPRLPTAGTVLDQIPLRKGLPVTTTVAVTIPPGETGGLTFPLESTLSQEPWSARWQGGPAGAFSAGRLRSPCQKEGAERLGSPSAQGGEEQCPLPYAGQPGRGRAAV